MVIQTIYAVGILLVILLIGSVIFLLQGPPFVPIQDDNLQEMIRFAKKYKPKRILDMGSGDGKLVIGLAEAGYTVDGVEINPLLAYRSKARIKKKKVQHATIFQGNFWSFDVSRYDMIVLYVVNLIMPRLEKKLLHELQTGTIIISKYAEFPGLQPIEKTGEIFVYRITRGKMKDR